MVQSNPFSQFSGFGSSLSNVGGFESFGFGNVPPVPTDNPFTDLLEFEPEIPFQGALQRANLSPNLLTQFQNQRSDIFNRFLGTFDEVLRRGEIPTARFADFIGNFDFEQEAFKTPPNQRPGGGTSRFAPRTQFFR